MKKKLFSFIFALAFILPCAFILAGCGDKNRVYLTMSDLPDHVEACEVRNIDGSANSDKKGVYFKKGAQVNITVNIETGFNIGDLKVFANENEISLTPYSSEKTNEIFNGSFIMDDNCNITFSGQPELNISTLTLIYQDPYGYNKNYENDVFIGFSNAEKYGLNDEYTLSQFKALTAGEDKTIQIAANEQLEMFIYTKGYHLGLTQNSVIYFGEDYRYVNAYFVEDGERYGLKTSQTFLEDSKMVIEPSIQEKISIYMVDEGDVLNLNNPLFDLKVNGEVCENVDFDKFESSDEITLAFEFKDAITAEQFNSVCEGLNFMISNQTSAFQFEKGDKTISLTLALPYHYSADYQNNMDTQYAYRYYIKTNLIEKLNENNLLSQKKLEYEIYVNGEIYEREIGSVAVLNTFDRNYVCSASNTYTYLKSSEIKIDVNIEKSLNVSRVKLGDIEVSLNDNSNDKIKIENLGGGDLYDHYSFIIDADVEFDKVEFFL